MAYKYRFIAELPKDVREKLPIHAQEIYKKAYNYAWDRFSSPGTQQTLSLRQDIAHKVAWTAVKNTYSASENQGRGRRNSNRVF